MIDTIALQEIHDTLTNKRADQGAQLDMIPIGTILSFVFGRVPPGWQALHVVNIADYPPDVTPIVNCIKLAPDDALAEMTLQRDMLANRCAEQARQIAALVNPFAPQPNTVADAIATMQRNGHAR